MSTLHVSKQILDLARVCRVKRTNIMELSVASPSPLGTSRRESEVL